MTNSYLSVLVLMFFYLCPCLCVALKIMCLEVAGLETLAETSTLLDPEAECFPNFGWLAPVNGC